MDEASRRAAFFSMQTTPGSCAAFDTVQEAMRRHREAGDLVVLLVPYTSFGIGPAADLVLAVDEWAAALRQPPVGPHDHGTRAARAKAHAVVETCARLRLDPARCFGYGVLCDHGQDILAVVGNPRAIVCSNALMEVAAVHGWPAIRVPSMRG